MKVYVVVEEWWTSDNGESYCIVGVFETREKAEACVAKGPSYRKVYPTEFEVL